MQRRALLVFASVVKFCELGAQDKHTEHEQCDRKNLHVWYKLEAIRLSSGALKCACAEEASSSPIILAIHLIDVVLADGRTSEV